MSEHASKRRVYTSKLGAAALLLPTIAFLVVFLYYPFVETFWLSFHRSDLLRPDRFVGLDNYVRMVNSETYRYSLLLSTAWAVAVVSLTTVLSLVISFLIHETERFSGLYLVASIWPYALPLAVAAVVLNFLLHPELGTFTFVLSEALGVSIDWHTDGALAIVVLTVAAVWQGLGYSIIFFTAALGQIPDSITEATRVDGIGRLNRLFRVYVPLISPTIVFLVVINSVGAFFGGFALVDLMTNGGPDGATNILIFKLYRDAFEFIQFGYAAAQSVVLFAIVGVLLYVQLRVSERYAYYG